MNGQFTEQIGVPEITETEKEQRKALEKLQNCFGTLLRSMEGGGTYAKYGDNGFSGDGASLYALVSFEEAEKPRLVKVGWGEFSEKTFTSDEYPEFRDLPINVYCISQRDSFFADEKLRQEMTNDPQKYLSECSLFMANSGKVELAEPVESTKQSRQTHQLNQNIESMPYNEMLRIVRNQIINKRTTPAEFASFLRELPDDLEELKKYTSKLQRMNAQLTDREEQMKPLMSILHGMGVECVGIAVGDEKAMKSILELKRSFNFETNSF